METFADDHSNLRRAAAGALAGLSVIAVTGCSPFDNEDQSRGDGWSQPVSRTDSSSTAPAERCAPASGGYINLRQLTGANPYAQTFPMAPDLRSPEERARDEAKAREDARRAQEEKDQKAAEARIQAEKKAQEEADRKAEEAYRRQQQEADDAGGLTVTPDDPEPSTTLKPVEPEPTPSASKTPSAAPSTPVASPSTQPSSAASC